MPEECQNNPCPYEQKIADTHGNTVKILDAINGRNGAPGMKTQIALIESWIEGRKVSMAAWNKALITAAIGLGIIALSSVLVLAARGVIKFP